MHGSAAVSRIGLLATTALLLGGDEVDLQVEVGAGAQLDLFDVAGTVAYHGRGAAAAWRTSLRVADGATLRMSGQPLVVADGADVTRTVEVDAAGTAAVLLRDTVVLGRTGERGGQLRLRTDLRVDGRLVSAEDQDLSREFRTLPGMLGQHRVLDTITALGRRVARPEPHPQLTRFELFGGAGTCTRYLGDELAPSPLHQQWDDVTVSS